MMSFTASLVSLKIGRKVGQVGTYLPTYLLKIGPTVGYARVSTYLS